MVNFNFFYTHMMNHFSKGNFQSKNRFYFKRRTRCHCLLETDVTTPAEISKRREGFRQLQLIIVFFSFFSGGRAQVKKPLADDLIQPAAKWLLDRRDEWGRDTPRALLAMRRASTNWDRHSLQSQLLTQKFDIELLLTLLKIQKQQSRNRRSTSQKQDGKSEDKHYSRSQDKKTDSSDWNRRNTDADSRFSHRHQDPKTDSSDWKLHNEDEKRYDANRKEDSDDSNWKRHNEDGDSRYSHRQDKTDDSDWKRRNDEERPYIDRRDESDSFEKNRSESDTVEPGSMTSPFQEQANILSRFALTLAAMCRNPRDFYENDIIGTVGSS